MQFCEVAGQSDHTNNTQVSSRLVERRFEIRPHPGVQQKGRTAGIGYLSDFPSSGWQHS
jgi:hypothetical protein